MKHTDDELKQWQALPLSIKLRMSQQRIRNWVNEYGEDGVYLSFSGGKDSTVLKHIIENMGYNIPNVFVNTGLEYPEIQKFAREQSDVILKPKMSFKEVIKKYGYPVISKEVSLAVYSARKSKREGTPLNYKAKQLYGLITNADGSKSRYDKSKYQYLVDAAFNSGNQCCDVMKKAPAKKYEKETGRKPFLATLAAESEGRASVWKRNGCNAFDAKRPVSTPLAFWTEQDILHYIVQNNVSYCSVYGDIIVLPKEDDLEGQISVQEWLGDYRESDILVTTKCDRTGCIFCMFGCHLEKSPNRFERLKKTHPKQYNYCIGGGEMVNGVWQPSKEGLGLGKVLDYINVKY